MTVLDKIDKLLKDKNKSQKELCQYLGINGQAYTNWKNGNTKSYRKYLPEIATFLGVTVDELVDTSGAAQQKPTEDDIKVALFGGAGEVTDKMWDEVKRFVEFVKQNQEKK